MGNPVELGFINVIVREDFQIDLKSNLHQRDIAILLQQIVDEIIEEETKEEE